MCENKFSLNIKLPQISFDMPITDLIMELEKLRYKIVVGTTPAYIFYQIRYIFQMLESIASSRIEGNHTTIMDYVEAEKLNSEYASEKESIKEIRNIEMAMEYIEDVIDTEPITIKFIRELHYLAVKDLSPKREGSYHPGEFRKENVRIKGSKHTPLDYLQVEGSMEDLIKFVNENNAPKYDLVKIAIAHHRFVWIHPFENGNGRVVRLFTYALLLKYVFKSKDRIINPAAVFCSDRKSYYDHLSMADKGDENGLIDWVTYMLEGLKNEIEKLDKLLDANYMEKEILRPAFKNALNNKYINDNEFKILCSAFLVKTWEIQSSNLVQSFPGKSSSDRSRMINALVKKRMIRPIREGARKYNIIFNNNYLLRSILLMLDMNHFLSESNSLI